MITRDKLLPAGRLREPVGGKRRADIILVSKCPSGLTEEEQKAIRKEIAPAPNQSLFYTTLAYGRLQALFDAEPERKLESLQADEHILLLTGIASPAPLIRKLSEYSPHVTPLTFPDHHAFDAEDMRRIRTAFEKLPEGKRLVITTEKDAARLIGHPDIDPGLTPYIYVLPVEVSFLNEEERIMFNQNIIAYVRENTRNSAFLKAKMQTHPETAIILGTGLGSLVHEITDKYEINYKDIPNFPLSTVEGHSGKLIFGKLGGKDILAMQGRFHFYEGYSMQQVTFPVRVMRELGIKTLFVSNAAGGMNPDFEIGDLMIITDHINLFPEHPLRGKNIDYGPRFPDMSEAYSKELIAKALEIAKEKGIKVQQGVYVGTQGPTFETPAEYKMFHILGGDAVGMSTVPEVIVANHCGIKVFGVSVITDLGVEGKIVEVSHEEVQKAADAAQPRMTTIMRELINRA